jgi:hypothetical protein
VDAVLQSIDTMIGDKVTSQYYSPLAAAEHISIIDPSSIACYGGSAENMMCSHATKNKICASL